MNDKERIAKLHEDLTYKLDTDEQTRFLRSGLNQEDFFILTFFHLFFDPSDQTEWIARFRACLNVPTPRQTSMGNADFWRRLNQICAKIGIDWPDKEEFLMRIGERFQREFGDAMRKLYERNDEQIAKLSEKLGNTQKRNEELSEELRNTQERQVDGEALFARRVALYAEQLAACERQRAELETGHKSIKERMTAISKHIYEKKDDLPQYRENLNAARKEYNDAFDALGGSDDTAVLNEAHACVVKALEELHNHQSSLDAFERAYVEEGNKMKAVSQQLVGLPQQQDYLCKAVQTLETARKLFGYDGEADLESLFPAEVAQSTQSTEESSLLSDEIMDPLGKMTLLQLIGPRSIGAARDAMRVFKLDTCVEFVAAIVSGDLEAKLNEVLAGQKHGMSMKSAKTLLETTIPNLKKRWMTKRTYDYDKMRSHLLKKLNYNPMSWHETA